MRRNYFRLHPILKKTAFSRVSGRNDDQPCPGIHPAAVSRLTCCFSSWLFYGIRNGDAGSFRVLRKNDGDNGTFPRVYVKLPFQGICPLTDGF